MENKLQAKDLITVGIFTAIYFALFFGCGLLGYIPILFVMMPLFVPLVTAIPFMLFITKVHTFGMVSIMATLLGILMFATGHTWMPLATSVVAGLAADLIFKAGDYRSGKWTVLGYGVFSLWYIGAFMPMFFTREAFMTMLEAGYGVEYANAIQALTPNWLLIAAIGVSFVAGIAGAFFGKAVLKKHFLRAGIA